MDSGTIRATSNGIRIDSAGIVSGGIHVAAKGLVSAVDNAIIVKNTPTFAGGIGNAGTISGGH